MADGIRATPYSSSFAGSANDILGGLLGYLRDPRRTQQAQGLAGLLESTGIPKTVERLAYGEPLTNIQQANVPVLRPETAEALMTLLPIPSGANKAAMAAGRAGEQFAERVVPKIMERGGLPASLLEGMASQTVSPLTVFHGSPAKFSKFDPTKIGSGEGAQAFGYGHYAAEAPAVAKGYQTTLTKDLVVPAQRALEKSGGDIDAAIKKASKEAQRLQSLDVTPATGAAKRDQLLSSELSKIDELTKYKQSGEWSSGNLYEINLPDEQIAKMLNLDKKLSEQPDIVRKSLLDNEIVKQYIESANIKREALNQANPERLTHPVLGKIASKTIDESTITAQAAYDQLSRQLGPEKASEMLRQSGIPGIRYFDEASRGTGEGTSNFVVFPGNEDLLTILKRNGGLLEPQPKNFQTSSTDASDIFGEGAKRIQYTDPNSGGLINVLQRPDGTASVLGLEVPEAMRGQGIGQALQSQVMQDFPEMMGQVSSKAAAKTAYRLGRRPPNQPEATLDDVYKIMDEYSSVNLVSPDMQKRFNKSLLD